MTCSILPLDWLVSMHGLAERAYIGCGSGMECVSRPTLAVHAAAMALCDGLQASDRGRGPLQRTCPDVVLPSGAPRVLTPRG
jgi:hypothetical protein